MNKFLVCILLLTSLGVHASEACRGALKHEDPEMRKKIEQASRADKDRHADPERRIKILTTLDTPDPSAPMLAKSLHGKSEWRVWYSSGIYASFSKLSNFLHGGLKRIKTVRLYYPNGVEIIPGMAWDPESFIRPSDGVRIGHAGIMQALLPGENPTMKDNVTRDRWWAEIKTEKNLRGEPEERWYFKAPLSSQRPDPRNWIGHSYGGSLFILPTGEPLRNLANGNYYYIREKNVEVKNGWPILTVIEIQEMDPSLTKFVGEPYTVFDGKNPRTNEMYAFTERDQDAKEGHLLEGPRPYFDTDPRVNRWQVLVSGGNFVTKKYGVQMIGPSPGAPLLSQWEVSLNESGTDGFDMATPVKQRFNTTWGVGRGVVIYDSLGKKWLSAAGIPELNLPEGLPAEGWPKSPEEFDLYKRQNFLIPVKTGINRFGQPTLVLDEDSSLQR